MSIERRPALRSSSKRARSSRRSLVDRRAATQLSSLCETRKEWAFSRAISVSAVSASLDP